MQPKQHLPGRLNPDVVHVEEGHKAQGPAGEGEDGELFEAGQVVEDEAGKEVGEGKGEEKHDCHRANMLEVVEDNQAGGQADEGKAGEDGGGVEDKVVQEKRRGHCHNASDLRKSCLSTLSAKFAKSNLPQWHMRSILQVLKAGLLCRHQGQSIP